MQIFKIIICIIVFVALQGLLPRFFNVDLTLVLTVYLALKRNPLQGTLVGASAGYSLDILSGVKLIGAGSFTKTVIGFVLSTINVHFAIDRKLTRLIILVVSSIVNPLLFLGLHYIFNQMPQVLTGQEIVKLTAWQAAGNLIIGFLVFPILDKIFAEESYLGGHRSANW